MDRHPHSAPGMGAGNPSKPVSRSLATGRRRRLLKVYLAALRLLGGYAVFRLASPFRSREANEWALSEYHRRSAARVRRTILDVQGLFIKVGQLISILTNFLPSEFRTGLEGLQDRIPARPLAEIEGRLRQELGGTADELFASFDAEPVASASLAQVHAARLYDGRRVAVKVQHLDVEVLARLDLQTIWRILAAVQLVLRIRGLTGAFEDVREMILGELDFEREALNVAAIAANFADDPGVSCPEVVSELSTRRVLTTRFVDGIKVTDRDALSASGVQPEAVAEKVLRAYCRMIFVDGIYHADPHPGNILVRPDGGIAFVDFGAVGRLSPGLKEGIPKLFEGVLRRDKPAILRALHQMGFVQHEDGGDTAEIVLEYFYSRFLEQLELDSWNLADIRVDTRMKLEVMADLGRLDVTLGEIASTFRVPKEWALLQRTLVLLIGVSSHLHPEMRPMAIIRPYLEEFVLGKDRDWVGLLTKAVRDMALSVLTIPDDLKRLLAQARRGEAQLEIRGVREGAMLLYALGHQLLGAAFCLGAGGLAYLAAARGEAELAVVLAAAAGASLLWLGGSILRARRWSRRLRRRTGPRRR